MQIPSCKHASPRKHGRRVHVRWHPFEFSNRVESRLHGVLYLTSLYCVAGTTMLVCALVTSVCLHLYPPLARLSLSRQYANAFQHSFRARGWECGEGTQRVLVKKKNEEEEEKKKNRRIEAARGPASSLCTPYT